MPEQRREAAHRMRGDQTSASMARRRTFLRDMWTVGHFCAKLLDTAGTGRMKRDQLIRELCKDARKQAGEVIVDTARGKGRHYVLRFKGRF
jgi:hypothetical protein